MTKEFAYVIALAGAAARGEILSLPAEGIDRQRLFALAKEQEILPLVCHALPSPLPTDCPDTFSAVLEYCARRGSVIALLEEMEVAGISCYVIKGFAAGLRYAAPEYRLCGDTDIVVAPADEERACSFLAAHGFGIRPRWEHGHHAVAVHPQMGIIEVHVRLYDELVQDVWFAGFDADKLVCEPKRSIHTPDGIYRTLGPTDHVIYMALHLVKHFICSGNSVRMMLDIALALTADGIDRERFWQTMDTLHYGKLLRCILWAWIRYGGFAETDFPDIGEPDTACVEMLLNDLETGGWLGKKEAQAREAGWHAYNRALLREKTELQYRLYMLNWRHRFHLRILFPDRKRMQRDYPLLQQHPLLLPVTWAHRILVRGTAWLGDEAIVGQTSGIDPISQARLRLFQQLHMIDL